MINKSFAIVGCGATALSFLHRHLDLVEAGEVRPNTIYVFEKREVFGCGAAYEPDIASNILNTKTAFITPFPDRPGHFKGWLDANEEKWKPAFPDFLAEPDSYAPRHLFGMYLAEQMRAIILRGATLDVQIVPLHAEVRDIGTTENGYIIRTACSLTISAAKVFLFTGTLSRKIDPADRDPRISDTPYPLCDLLEAIAPDEDVGIIGARLSAIDTVIALVESGHRGRIRLHSRSGFFPAVRGTQGRVATSRFSAEGVNSLVAAKGLLEISDIARLFLEEMELYGPIEKFTRLPTPPSDLRKYLEDEIEAAKSPRIWQAVLYTTNGFVEKIWRCLSPRARSEFLSDYLIPTAQIYDSRRVPLRSSM